MWDRSGCADRWFCGKGSVFLRVGGLLLSILLFLVFLLFFLCVFVFCIPRVVETQENPKEFSLGEGAMDQNFTWYGGT